MKVYFTTHAASRLMQRRKLIPSDIKEYLSDFMDNFKGTIKGNLDVVIYPLGERVKLYGHLKANSFKVITVLKN